MDAFEENLYWVSGRKVPQNNRSFKAIGNLVTLQPWYLVISHEQMADSGICYYTATWSRNSLKSTYVPSTLQIQLTLPIYNYSSIFDLGSDGHIGNNLLEI